MDRWTDHQNFAAAGEQREEIASVHRAAIRSIQRVVSENATPHDEEYASAGIAELLKGGKVLVLTGAGVSTESGIPDYRGPGGSLHDHRPMTYQEFRYDDAARQRYWARSYVGWRRMRRAEPNRAHYALAELEQLGAVSGVITQNVDGLHAPACWHCTATSPVLCAWTAGRTRAVKAWIRAWMRRTPATWRALKTKSCA